MSGLVRYFISYRSAKLPLQLVNELNETELQHRNFYYRGIYNSVGLLTRCQKIVYGEIESEHLYRYNEAGRLVWAQIIEDGEAQEISF